MNNLFLSIFWILYLFKQSQIFAVFNRGKWREKSRKFHLWGLFAKKMYILPRNPDAPRCWNIYLHKNPKNGTNVGKYSSTMEHLGKMDFNETKSLSNNDGDLIDKKWEVLCQEKYGNSSNKSADLNHDEMYHPIKIGIGKWANSKERFVQGWSGNRETMISIPSAAWRSTCCSSVCSDSENNVMSSRFW